MKQMIVLEVEQPPDRPTAPHTWDWQAAIGAPCRVVWAGPLTDDGRELIVSALDGVAQAAWFGEAYQPDDDGIVDVAVKEGLL